ncbi:unnamed protein product [Kuraishia capsulata CBS 1993]|uniref:Peptidase M20 dimerisation domain-containing protein n=1 Tax=Kuraishia capsulata CBS 1993 TaxID=1382522 RepID=W6MVL4_9ASCO|nr:uncharacterized protein KUCA_T00002342001 [Kuraishia capsulata CBS 1993]CDK26370.1 unnamed protein product [Kuraishia capsulata CBS 1993]
MEKTQRPSNFKAYRFVVLGLTLVVAALYHLRVFEPLLEQFHKDVEVYEQTCPVSVKIAPSSFSKDNSTVFKIINSPEFRNESAGKLSKAVQVDTQIGDVWPDVPEAPEQWAIFKAFHAYLEETFPTVYENLKVETVNTYGLVYTWAGSDPSLKPSMYTAHQDTVPIQEDTIKDWTYPPLSGHYDGDTVYGRGASDCKNLLVALLETVELLLADGFKPTRTALFVFGFDEEAQGTRGAKHLGAFLDERYGKDGIYSILDEGSGVVADGEKLFGIATVREKGYMDLAIELTTPGGHSSLPPDHTSIGIMSQLINLIEADVYEKVLTDENPYLQFLQCQAEHSDVLPAAIKEAVLRAKVDDEANAKVIEYMQGSRASKYLIQTSQSVDIINGGAKANAIPENTRIVINHRIAIEKTSKAILDRMLGRVQTIARKNEVGLIDYYGNTVLEPTPLGFFNLSILGGNILEPSPVTPSEGEVWDLVAGVTRHVFEDVVFPDMKYPLVMAPVVFSGNTDTRYYWNLTKNIFRYTPAIMDVNLGHIHSVDEQQGIESHLQAIAFFYEFLQAIEE